MNVAATFQRKLRDELGCKHCVGLYFDSSEHCWETEIGLTSREMNHHFVVSIAGLASGSSPPARDDLLPFFWPALNAIETLRLRPAPWWASTLYGLAD